MTLHQISQTVGAGGACDGGVSLSYGFVACKMTKTRRNFLALLKEFENVVFLACFLTRCLFVQPLEGDAGLSLAARLQPDAASAVGVDEAVGDVPRAVAEAAALVALQRRRWKRDRKIYEICLFINMLGKIK